MKGKLKIGDLVRCHYSHHTGIGYAKVLKIINKSTREEYQVYDNVITGHGEKNSPLDVIVNFVGYDFNDEYLSSVVNTDETKSLNPVDIYGVYTETDVLEMKRKWETEVNKKFNFLYEHVNRDTLEGRKSIPNMKF